MVHRILLRRVNIPRGYHDTSNISYLFISPDRYHYFTPRVPITGNMTWEREDVLRREKRIRVGSKKQSQHPEEPQWDGGQT